jgi:hypothetical protein
MPGVRLEIYVPSAVGGSRQVEPFTQSVREWRITEALRQIAGHHETFIRIDAHHDDRIAPVLGHELRLMLRVPHDLAESVPGILQLPASQDCTSSELSLSKLDR